MKHWLIWVTSPFTILLPACEPTSTDSSPTEIVETTLNPDSTTTVARKVNGKLEGRALTYWPSGVLAGISYLHEDQLEGIQRRFHKNGKLAEWLQYHRSKLEGKSYEFFESGAPASVTHYANGQRKGCHVLFYEQPRDQVRVYVDFVIGDGHEWKNRYVAYDPKGNITERFGFPRAYATLDTIPLGDSLTLHLRVQHPKHSSVLAVIGDYDEQFRLRDSASLRSIQGKAHTATARIPATQRGQQIVRGYLSDFKEIGVPRTDGSVTVKGQRLYFAYPYFVR